MPNTRVLYTLPAGVRSAVEAEARRRGSTPSRVAAEFFQRYLPTFIAESIRLTIESNFEREPHADERARVETASGRNGRGEQ